MNSNKYEGHTPGPLVVAVHGETRMIETPVGKPVAAMVGPADDEPWDEVDANASLLADAPALLAHCTRLAEALREMLQEAEAYEEDGTRFDRERNQRARAALAEYEKESGK